MIEREAASAALVYEGEPIRRRDEKLNLTDMWRASGADPSKRPAEWARYEGAPFVEFIADSLNMGQAHIIEAERGRDGGTWAHWQVGLAYAKYLSPAFHAWCNEVVRDHMEGQLAPNLRPIAVVDATVVAAEFGRVMQKAMREELGGALAPMDQRHTDVLRDIRALEISPDLGRSWFREVTYHDPYGRAARTA